MMKRLFSMMALLLLFTIDIWAQSGMTDTQILQYVIQQKRLGKAESEIATELLKQGATLAQIQQMRQKYSQQLEKVSMGGVVDKAIGDASSRMRKNNAPLREIEESDQIYSKRMQNRPPEWLYDNSLESRMDFIKADSLYFESTAEKKKKVFGRDIFNNKYLTFEPQMNIATPQNYVLGPGDQLVIDVFGNTQQSEILTISPDGEVTVPNVGPIQVSGLTVSAAQSRIRGKMGKFYTDSDIKVTVGQTRTIIVNVMGEVKAPGTYTLSAFSTVFNALYMAGGISDLGTLRNVKVIRNGRQISVVDIYEFILNGRLSGNVRLQDNDVVQVGAYECIVDISGRVKRPMAYEMRKTESLATLLKYSGGFTGDAYKKLIRVLRKSEDLKSVYNVEEFELSDFKMDDGDSVIVDSIINRYKNMVEVRGAVYRPGMYHLGGKISSVRSLIEYASGLSEEAMTARAVVRRVKSNRTHEVVPIDLDGIMNGIAADVPLQNEDVLFVPTLAEHQNLRTLTIDGEVICPGTYEYSDKMAIEDLVLMAGGLTDDASRVKIDVSRRIIDPQAREASEEVAKVYSFELNPGFSIDYSNSFFLEPYDVVHVRRSPISKKVINVFVEGEVTFEGVYSLEKKNQRLSDVVKSAGGLIPGSNARGARLLRKMNDDEKARMQAVLQVARQGADGKDSINIDKIAISDTYTIGIHLDEALAHPGSTQDVELVDGDRLIVPSFNHTVRISGDVNAPNTVAFDEGKGYKYYIKQAGGFGERAKKSHAYIVYQNGTMALAKEGKIEPGCEVVVPTKRPRDAQVISQWLGIGTSVASLATMVATIANLLK
jgi:protein involved in polysaccharide export with SLBB domain